jgi:NADP-dependent 3-hydroxy acid dehydrogenase YdfG
MMLLIVGAGPRLGEAVARRFGQDGYDVGLIARDEPRLAELAGRLEDAGVTTGWAVADIADAAALTSAVGRLADHAGGVDVLLHNASAWRAATTLELTPDELLADLAIGAASLLTAAQAVVPAMRAAGGGTILATGSGAADSASPGAASLGPQKAALRALVRALDADLRDDGIHCATVTVRGFIREGTRFAPARIADLYAELVAETAGPREKWQTVVDLT